jgi:phospholipid transport system substrate-binding protein
LSDSFDFEMPAKKSLSAKDWDAQDAASQEKFVSEFKCMVRNSSAKRLELYRADSTIY